MFTTQVAFTPSTLEELYTVCLVRWEKHHNGTEAPENVDLSPPPSKLLCDLLGEKTLWTNRKQLQNTRSSCTVWALTHTLKCFLNVFRLWWTAEDVNHSQPSKKKRKKCTTEDWKPNVTIPYLKRCDANTIKKKRLSKQKLLISRIPPTFLLFPKPASFRAEHPNDGRCSAKAAGQASRPASCSQNV